MDNLTDSDSDSHSVTEFEVNGTTYSAGETANLSEGDLTINADGSYTFVPAANYNGDVPTATYTVVDNNDSSDTDTSTLDITVNAVNDLPTTSNSEITMNEDTTYTYKLSDFNFSDVDGDSISKVRVDTLPVLGVLLFNGVVVSAGDEISASDIDNGLLTYKPAEHDSGSDQYAGDTRNDGTTVGSDGVGDQEVDYAQFNYSVSDGTNWSASSATMTIDVNAVADTPILSANASSIEEFDITIDNVNDTDKGYLITAYKADGSESTISTHTNPDGFGVAGSASGADAELGYSDDLDLSEALKVELGQLVSSVDVSFAWKHSHGDGETAKFEFYRDGVKVGEGTHNGGSDGVDPAITLSPDNGAYFDTVIFSAVGSGDDYLIHSITYDKVDITSATIDIAEDDYAVLNISSSLVDTDGSESLTLEVRDIPEGATISDGTHTFTADNTSASVDITGWDIDALRFISPNISQDTTYTLNVIATATEYSNDDANSTTLPITINVNAAPEVSDSVARVSEEGLDNGLVDDDGQNSGDDTTDTAIVTGSVNIVDSDSVTVSLSAPTQTMTSNGNTIVWDGEGTQLLTGTANGVDVMTIEIAQNGDYTVTLLAPVDHPNNSVEDLLSVNVGVSVSDGVNDPVTSTLTIGIEDDMGADGDKLQNIVIPEQNTNLMFIIDTSGSMGSDVDDGNGGSIERMELALKAVIDTINSYDDIGNVRVQLVTFDSGDDSTHQAEWLSATDALALLGDGSSGSRDAVFDPNGGTDYDQALLEAKLGWEVDGKIPTSVGDVANVAYFLSDGQPQTAGGSEDSEGITGDEIKDWTDYVTAQGIDVYAIGIGSGLDSDDREYLDPIAYDGVNNVDRDGILVTNDAELSQTLLSTIQAPVTGSVLGDLNSNIDGFGADGGYFASITLDSVTYTYDVTNDTITDSDGNTITGHILEVDTSLNGHLKLDFVSGQYEYQPDIHLAEGSSEDEVFTYVARDNDGDETGGTITLHVTRAAHEVSVTSSDEADVYESAMSSGTDSQSDAEVVSGNLFANDTVANGAMLKDVYIGAGTTSVDADGNFVVTTIEGNTLVVNKDTGDYTYTLNNALQHTQRDELANDTFTGNSKDGWTLSRDLNNNNDRLRIDGDGDTATKTFDFGSANAGKTVLVSFDIATNGNWDDDQTDFVKFSSNTDGELIHDAYSADASHSYVDIPVTLDSDGKVTFTITADSTTNNEDLFVDNFKVSMETPLDTLDDSFTYVIEDLDATEHTANLDITIHDDAPVAQSQTTDLTIEPVTTNLAIIVDISSSMSDEDLALTEDAIQTMVDNYSAMGSVNVNIVQFYGDGHYNSTWVDSTNDLETFDWGDGENHFLDNSKGGTDIEQGLRSMVEDSYSGNQPQSDQDVMYFFGDGNTYDDYEDDFEAYLPTWNSFVTSGAIDKLFSYSVNTDSVVEDIAKVADNEENIVSADAVNIDDVADLADAVSETAKLYVEGNLTEDISGNTIIEFGADDGHISSVTIGSNSVDYDENNPLQTVTGEHGDFEINFDTGAFRYIPTDNIETTETINATIVDNDGDTLNTVLVDVNVHYSDVFNDTLDYDGTTAVDGGAGYDTLVISNDINLDFSDTNLANIANIEKIDLNSGDHTLDNLSLDDVLDMTDSNNTLEIIGDGDGDATIETGEDNVSTIDTQGWNKLSETHDDTNGTTTYEYSKDGSSDSITLVIDDNINNTGL